MGDLRSLCLRETYEDVKDRIAKLVWQHKRRGDPEEYRELLGEANLLFIKAYDTFNHKKGASFTTWLVRTIRDGLIESMRLRARRAHLLKRVMDDPDSHPCMNSGWNLDDFLSELSDEALEAVGEAVGVWEASEDPRAWWDDVKRAKHARRELIKRLKTTHGWEREEIAKVFQEIREAIND